MGQDGKKALSLTIDADSRNAVKSINDFKASIGALSGVTREQINVIRAATAATNADSRAKAVAISTDKAAIVAKKNGIDLSIKQQRLTTEQARSLIQANRAGVEAARIAEVNSRALISQAKASGVLAQAQARTGVITAKSIVDIARARELDTRAMLNQARAADVAARQSERQEKAENGSSKGGKGGNAFSSVLNLAKGAIISGGNLGLQGIKAIINEQRDFQTTMNNLRGNMEVTDAEFAKMQSATMELGKQTGASFGDIGAAFMRASNYSFAFADSMKIVTIATKSAVGSGADLGKTADLLASVMHNFNLSGDQAATTMNMIHETALMGAMTLEEFTERAKPTLSVAAELGVSLKDALAAFVSLTKGGNDAAQSATQFRAIITKLVNPTKATFDEIDKLKDLTGIDLTEAFSLGGLKAKGFAAFIDQVRKATKGHEDAVLKLTAAQRGGLGLLRLVTGGYDDMASAGKRLDDVINGKLDPTTKNFARQQHTLDGALADFSNQVKVLVDEHGPGFLDFLTRAVNTSERLGGHLDNVIDRLSKLAGFSINLDPLKSINAMLDTHDEYAKVDAAEASAAGQAVTARDDIEYFKSQRASKEDGEGFVQINGELRDRLARQLGSKVEIPPTATYAQLNGILDSGTASATGRVKSYFSNLKAEKANDKENAFWTEFDRRVKAAQAARLNKPTTTLTGNGDGSDDKDDKADDAAEAKKVLAGWHKDSISRLLEAAKDRFKDGLGKDSDKSVMEQMADSLRKATIDEATTAYQKDLKNKPRTAGATFKVATSDAETTYADFKKTIIPQLSDERNKKLDEALSKKIENRAKDYETYGANASPERRKAVLDEIAAMRKQLRTTEAQTEADTRVAAAKKSVDTKLQESVTKYHEQIDKNAEAEAQIAQKRHEADIALLGGRLEEAKELPERLAIRQQILDAENARIDAEKAAKDAALDKESAALSGPQGGKLTDAQVQYFDLKHGENEFDATDAKAKARQAFTTGSAEDKRTSAGSLAEYYRDKSENGGTVDDLYAAQAKERESQPTLSKVEADMLADRQKREIDEFLQKAAQESGMRELGRMALGQKGSFFNAFRQLDNAEALSSPKDKAGILSEQASSLTEMAKDPDSKLDKTVIIGRLRDLQASAASLGDVKLVMQIKADATELTSSLKPSFMEIALDWGDQAGRALIGKLQELGPKFFSDLFSGASRGKFTDAKGHRITYQRAFTNEAKTNLETTAGQQVGNAFNSFNSARIHEIKDDLDPVFSRWASELKTSLKEGGASAATDILEGAAALGSAAMSISAALGAGGKKKKYGGLIGNVLGGIVGSFIGGPGGGWKAGSALGGSLGGMLGFASGGEPPVGRTSVVGDRVVPAFSPELIMPKAPVNVLNKTQVHSVMQAMGAVPGSAFAGAGGLTVNFEHHGHNYEASDRKQMQDDLTNNIIDRINYK